MIKHWFSSFSGDFLLTVLPWVKAGSKSLKLARANFQDTMRSMTELTQPGGWAPCHWTIGPLDHHARWVGEGVKVKMGDFSDPSKFNLERSNTAVKIDILNPKKSWRWMESDDFPDFQWGWWTKFSMPLIFSGSCLIFWRSISTKMVGRESVEVFFWNEDVQMKRVHRGIGEPEL